MTTARPAMGAPKPPVRPPLVEVVSERCPPTRLQPDGWESFSVVLEGHNVRFGLPRDSAEALAKRLKRALAGFRKPVRQAKATGAS